MRSSTRIVTAAALWLAALAPVLAGPRSVAVTFDDLPCVPAEGSTAEQQIAINRRIVQVLSHAEVPAVGFVNSVRLEVDGVLDAARLPALEAWLDAGFELGNHSHSHPSLHRTALADYLADVERGAKALRPVLAAHERQLRWFRHPYLHTGRELEAKRAVESFLADHGMRVAPVTIDNGEWIYARAFLHADEARNEESKRRVADSYLAYMESKVDYFERQSRASFGREIPQVLLVHANRLNAENFARIVEMLAGRGYRFVRLETALADEAYRSPDTYTGAAGISWLHRWALSGEPPRRVVPDEPQVPEWVMRAAGVDSE